MTNDAPANAEPEIEAFRRVAHGFLTVLRAIAFVAGIAAIAAAVWFVLRPEAIYSDAARVPPIAERIAKQATLACFGLPLLLRVRWLTRRMAPVLVAGGLAMWLLPCLLPGDITWGFAVRAFASSVAITALLLWRTLRSLAEPTAAPS